MGRKMQYNVALDPEVLSLYKKGFSLREIGRALDIHHKTVGDRLRLMNVPIRNRSDSMVIHHLKRKANNG